MISRRTLLRSGVAVAGAVGGAGLVVPGLTKASAAPAGDLDPTTIPKYLLPMPVPQPLTPDAGTTDTYTMVMKYSNVGIVPGYQTSARTFNGTLPGPLIRATSGQRVVINQNNYLDVPVSVHMHGASVPPDSDGAPMDMIAAKGGTKTYTYPNVQPHSNLWYHDHAHGIESENTFNGLSGFYQITDPIEQSLNLPSGDQDVTIGLRDARLDSSGQFLYQMDDFQNRNIILANGIAWPYFNVQARKYRFRFTNMANMRFFSLGLSDGSSFQQIASDGGLLAAPYTTTSLPLSPGERADIVIDFSQYAFNTSLTLTNTLPAPLGGPAGLGDQVLQFRVVGPPVTDTSVVPAVLRTLPALPPATVNRTIDLHMDQTGLPTAQGYINGQVYDPNRIDTTITYGATEIWTVTNSNTLIPHNFHLHLVQFRVLERNGVAVTSGSESGLKDTVQLMPGETVKLQATFTGYRGNYLYHCHIIDHASMGMMATMQIV